MSSGAIAMPASSGPSPPPTQRRLRLSLSGLQDLVSTGKVLLAKDEIRLFHQKGFLRPETATALVTISEGSTLSSPISLTTPSSSSSSATPAHHTRSVPGPNAAAGSPVGSLSTSWMSTPSARAPSYDRPSLQPRHSHHTHISRDQKRHRHHHHQSQVDVVQPTGQLHPPIHTKIFDDTCSHLNPAHPDFLSMTPPIDPSASFRRHSESSSLPLAQTSVIPVPPPASKHVRASLSGGESLLQLTAESHGTLPVDLISGWRRFSMLHSTPVEMSPQGRRTVLYTAASASHTLYSLPAKPLDQPSYLDQQPSRTPAMNDFKFPADSNSTQSRPANSPALDASSGSSPSTASASSSGYFSSGPITPTPTRSKRKRTPMKSPSWGDSQDQSPGVIFQLPFGSPQQKSYPTPRMESSTSADAPSSNYPSPASSTRALNESTLSTGGINPPLLDGGRTPASPTNRSGLGIQVGLFSEPDATHPLGHSPRAVEQLNLGMGQDIEAGVSLGDIVVAEQEASRSAEQDPTNADKTSEGMPTPPMTSRVLPVQVMQHMVLNQTFTESTNPPLTPSTPITTFAPTHERGVSSVSTPRSMAGNERESTSNPLLPTPTVELSSMDSTKTAQNQSEFTETDTTHNGSQEFTTAEDPSNMPLWAQRQLSIRRQSLIPRVELNFVSGSGILPEASKDLRTRDGATILVYPVLLSDMVQVALDDAQPKEDEDPEQDGSDSAEHQPAPKRRKGPGGRKRTSTASVEVEAVGALNNEQDDSNAIALDPVVPTREVPQRHGVSRYRRDRAVSGYRDTSFSKSPTPPPAGTRRKNKGSSSKSAMLGSPIELSIPTFGAPKQRRGSRVKSSTRLSAANQHQDEIIIQDDDYEQQEYEEDEDMEKRSYGPVLSDMDDGEETEEDVEMYHRSRNHRHTESIPGIHPSEVDVAMKHARDMLKMHEPAMGHPLRSLQPLLDAIQSEQDYDTEESDAEPARRGKGRGQGKNAKGGKAGLDTMKKGKKTGLGSKKSTKDDSLTGKKGRKSIMSKEHEASLSLASLSTAASMVMLQSGIIDADATEDELENYKPRRNNSNHNNSNHNKSEEKQNRAKVETKRGSKANGAQPKKKAVATEQGRALKSPVTPGQGSSSVGRSHGSSKHCEACGANETPCWRPGYFANTVLCNSCGLRYKKSGVFCTKPDCKYIPLKTEYASMEADRVMHGRDHLICQECKQRVALPSPKDKEKENA